MTPQLGTTLPSSSCKSVDCVVSSCLWNVSGWNISLLGQGIYQVCVFSYTFSTSLPSMYRWTPGRMRWGGIEWKNTVSLSHQTEESHVCGDSMLSNESITWVRNKLLGCQTTNMWELICYLLVNCQKLYESDLIKFIFTT